MGNGLLDDLKNAYQSARDNLQKRLLAARDRIHSTVGNVDWAGVAIGILDPRVGDARATLAGSIDSSLPDSSIGSALANKAADFVYDSSMSSLDPATDKMAREFNLKAPQVPVSAKATYELGKSVMEWVGNFLSDQDQ